MECATSDIVNGLENVNLQETQQAEDKTPSPTLYLDLFDCPICIKPLTIPIFQCDNGHLACASCCPKLSNKCPSCASRIGYIRCRAMESALESIFIPCRNAKLGCTENVFYGKEAIHEKECNFSLCSSYKLDISPCQPVESASSEVNGLSNIHLQKKQQTKDKTRSAIVDLGFLYCSICVEQFTVPIFQCDNGHLACASCCPKLSNKCPSCAWPIGHIRCRAMERVLESVSDPCRNAKLGCKKRIPCWKESTHEKECIFSLCSCPIQDCNYTGLYSSDMYSHFVNEHQNKYKVFKFGICFRVQMNIVSDKILVIMEDTNELVFAVQCFKEPYGVYVTVSCIAPPAPEVGQFSYCVAYNVDGAGRQHTMIYKPPTVKRVLKVSFDLTTQENFMLIPNRFLRGRDVLELSFGITKLK